MNNFRTKLFLTSAALGLVAWVIAPDDFKYVATIVTIAYIVLTILSGLDYYGTKRSRNSPE